MKKVLKTNHHSFPVLIEESKDGFYAECPVLEACYTQGDTYEEVIKNIKEVIELCIKTSIPKIYPFSKEKQYSLSLVDVALKV